MAAEALLGFACEKLLSLIQVLSGIKKKTEKISSTLALIKGVLEDAEEKQMTDHSVKVWLQQLKDAVYVLDDILDECSIKSHRLHGLSSWKPKNVAFRHQIGIRLKEISKRFDQIADAKNKFLLREGVREWPNEVSEWRQTTAIISQPQVYGRDEDKEKIVEFLLHQAPTYSFLSIYPIVGLAGLGKTTLAQLVYNDQRVSSHFGIKVWVCVSENFSIQRILLSIIETITREEFKISNLDLMGEKVQELLKRQSKPYLLVLDDVWKRSQKLKYGLSQDKWDQLKSMLSCGLKGSSVLVSTRDVEVAAIMGTCPTTHHLYGLSDEDCWLLFKQCAFGATNEECTELVAIGKDIAKKCGGLPLAARALGGLMRSKNGKKEWLQVKESRLWALHDADDILPALRLSYIHLTPTLRQCFAFCAIFPKDTKIEKEELIHLWMANGFISSHENLEAEDVGNKIWNELYQKSLFQDIQTHEDTGDISFKMHDLVHDLARSVTGEECMILENDNTDDLSKSTHHVCFGFANDISFNKRGFQKVESLRTLYQQDIYLTISNDGFPANCSLRVLRTGFRKLTLLDNLIHLRYLEIYDRRSTQTLPDSICKLRKLEILKLIQFDNLKSLPKDMSCLENLRHLMIDSLSLRCMFPHISKLSCLRSLSVYIASSETGYSLAELSGLNLGGKLTIKDLNNVAGVSEAQEANLKDKTDLQELCLSWGRSNVAGPTESDATSSNGELVLEALQPHSNLKRFGINFYEGLRWPSWMGNDSTCISLVLLELYRCNNCQHLPPLGKLPSLRKLELSYMDNVQYVDDGSYGGVDVRPFPSLKELTLYNLPNVERLLKMERGDMFPNLSELHITDCPKIQLPTCLLPSLTILELSPCTNELLRPISNFTGLTSLTLRKGSKDMTLFPEGMMKNLTSLKSLDISSLYLKELPNEFVKLSSLEYLYILSCGLVSFPEHGCEGLCALRRLSIIDCGGLRSLPEGFRLLTSLEYLTIGHCPTLRRRCLKGGEDWHKIAHVPSVDMYDNNYD